MSNQEANAKTIRGLKRRTVLQSAGVAAGALTLGVSTFSGSVTAQDSFRLYTLTPSTQVYEGEAEDEYATASDWRQAFDSYGIENQHLLVLSGQGEPQEAIPINPVNVAGDTSTQVVQAATLAYNQDEDLLYGIANQNYGPVDLLEPDDDRDPGRYVFTIDPSTGDLTLVGGPTDDLRYLWGSTFSTDGSVYYALQSDARPGFDHEFLYTVDVGSTSTIVREVGDVSEVIGDRKGDEVVHTGLSWNQLAPQYNIVSILGNISGSKDDLVEIDPEPLDAQVAAQDVFDTGELVSTGFNPCVGGDPSQQRVYTIRNGNEFFSADVEVTNVSQLATITGSNLDNDPLVVVDNLAEDPAKCALACTRTIGYWKNHAGHECPSLKTSGHDDKDTIYSVLEECGGIVVGDDTIYDGQDDLRFDGDDLIPNYTYDLKADCADVATIVEVLETLDEAESDDMDLMLLAQLLAAKLNVCNGATTSDGMGGDIRDTIALADGYFSDLTDSEGLPSGPSHDTLEEWKDRLDGYNNQNVALQCDDDE